MRDQELRAKELEGTRRKEANQRRRQQHKEESDINLGDGSTVVPR